MVKKAAIERLKRGTRVRFHVGSSRTNMLGSVKQFLPKPTGGGRGSADYYVIAGDDGIQRKVRPGAVTPVM